MRFPVLQTPASTPSPLDQAPAFGLGVGARPFNVFLALEARSDVPVDGGISSPKPPTANSVDSNAFTAPPPSTIGPPPTTPNVPPSTDACSYYLDGTGAGVVVHSICLHTGDNSWSNCVRGGLMQQWIPRSNPFQLGRYLVEHVPTFVGCSRRMM